MKKCYITFKKSNSLIETSNIRILFTIFFLILLQFSFIPLNFDKNYYSQYKLNILQGSNDFGQIDSLDLTVICDNYPSEGLTNEWGLSILIETKDAKILFDTGQSYSGLRDNSLALNKDLSQIDFVVISHEHWDHVGGLTYIEEVNPNVTVYVPNHLDSQLFNTINESDLNVIKISDTTIIQQGIAIIGEIFGPPYEQALVVNIEDVGLVGIVGCSHPGVENLIEKAITDLGINAYMVMGGFHLASASEETIQNTIDRLVTLNVKKIYPIHCSGDLFRQYMKDNYPLNYGLAQVGFQMKINSFTINSTFYYILIPVLVFPLTIIMGWIIRQKMKHSKKSF